MVYSIEAAKQCPYIQRVVVSTDDPEIAEISSKAGAETPFLRPPEYSHDSATTVQVLNHALDWFESHENYKPGILVLLQPTDVFRSRQMVDEVVKRLIERDDLDTVFCAYREMKNYWYQVNGSYLRLDKRELVPRQIKKPIFREDSGLACATRPYVIRSGRYIGDRVDLVLHSEVASHIDIHDEYDLFLAEKTLTEWGKRVNE